jgi:OmpA-OmpF porin, OOP family
MTVAVRRLWGAAGAAVLLVVTGGQPATAQDEGGGEPRVVDLEFRVVDLTYRSTSFGGASATEETPDQVTVSLAADVLFEFDRADLTPAAQAQLDAVVQDLSALGERAVTIVGHTDDVGEDAYNQDLSTRRAQTVQAALAGSLGGGYTFDVSGRGETEPVAPNTNDDGSDNPAGRAANRRVVISYPKS